MQSNGDGQNPSNNPTQITDQPLKVDDTVEAEITRIADFGAFAKLSNGKKGLIHISQISDSYVKNVSDHLKVGDKVKARVATISPDGKIDLSLKSQKEAPSRAKDRPRRFEDNPRVNMSSSPNGKAFRSSSLEEELKHFLKESDERQADPKKHPEEKQGRRKF